MTTSMEGRNEHLLNSASAEVESPLTMSSLVACHGDVMHCTEEGKGNNRGRGYGEGETLIEDFSLSLSFFLSLVTLPLSSYF